MSSTLYFIPPSPAPRPSLPIPPQPPAPLTPSTPGLAAPTPPRHSDALGDGRGPRTGPTRSLFQTHDKLWELAASSINSSLALLGNPHAHRPGGLQETHLAPERAWKEDPEGASHSAL